MPTEMRYGERQQCEAAPVSRTTRVTAERPRPFPQRGCGHSCATHRAISDSGGRPKTRCRRFGPGGRAGQRHQRRRTWKRSAAGAAADAGVNGNPGTHLEPDVVKAVALADPVDQGQPSRFTARRVSLVISTGSSFSHRLDPLSRPGCQPDLHPWLTATIAVAVVGAGRAGQRPVPEDRRSERSQRRGRGGRAWAWLPGGTSGR